MHVVLAIGLPLLLVIAIILSIFLPRVFIQPTHRSDFIFMQNNFQPFTRPFMPDGSPNPSTDPLFRYAISDGKLTIVSADPYSYNAYRREELPKIFKYDVLADTYEEIKADDLSKINVVDTPKSPEGFEIVRGGGDGVLMFPSYSSNKAFLKKGSYSQELTLPSKVNIDSRYCYGDFLSCGFVGWVGEGNE